MPKLLGVNRFLSCQGNRKYIQRRNNGNIPKLRARQNSADDQRSPVKISSTKVIPRWGTDKLTRRFSKLHRKKQMIYKEVPPNLTLDCLLEILCTYRDQSETCIVLKGKKEYSMQKRHNDIIQHRKAETVSHHQVCPAEHCKESSQTARKRC